MPASNVDMSDLVRRKACLRRYAVTDCTPLMEEWERVLDADNRRRALAGLDCDNQPMTPTLREMGVVSLEKRIVTLGAQFEAARKRTASTRRDARVAGRQAKRSAKYLDVDVAAENRRILRSERELKRIEANLATRETAGQGLAAAIRERKRQLKSAERGVAKAKTRGDARGQVQATATRRDLEGRLARLTAKLEAARKGIEKGQARGSTLAKRVKAAQKLSHLAVSAHLDRGVYKQAVRDYRAASRRSSSLGRALGRVGRTRRGMGNGPPLAPHGERSRIIRFARTRHGQLKASLAWFAELGWRSFTDTKGRGILGHHQRGIPSRRGPIVRDVLSHVSPTAFAECRDAARAFWLVQLRMLGGG